ncbi:prepilin peptidase [Aminipila butyrica]|uniref:Prepilin peptidase n=1 Tax=Aminipila butyrica TaxID=433296 RepID=A0A858BX66_9FIRM|nr:prepilin peptidase [Aminipila butyrica]
MLAILLSLPILIYVGISDWKHRLIPNAAILILLAMGILQILMDNYFNFHIDLIERITGLLFPGIILFVIYMKNPKLSGGGDLKLLASLGFCIGISYFIATLFVACIGGIAHSLRYKQVYVPLGTYICIGAVIVTGVNFVQFFY